MTTQTRQLTVDEAMGEFQAVLREERGDTPRYTAIAPETPQTPEEAEAKLFRFAEYMLGLACPDPTDCTDQHCRRNRLCRHLERLRAKQRGGVSTHPRRTPGAEAARYAIWVYMSSGR